MGKRAGLSKREFLGLDFEDSGGAFSTSEDPNKTFCRKVTVYTQSVEQAVLEDSSMKRPIRTVIHNFLICTSIDC